MPGSGSGSAAVSTEHPSGPAGSHPSTAPDVPPAGLLEDLLEQASHPGVKGRAAVPVRGAVTGARPLLSAVLLLVGAAVGGAVGYACWRLSLRLRRR